MDDRSIQRCAIYTRKSSEHGLEQSFNSLHAQREACEAYIKSQAHAGWQLRPTVYDDGGISGGHVERPALQALLLDIRRNLRKALARISRFFRDSVFRGKLIDATSTDDIFRAIDEEDAKF